MQIMNFMFVDEARFEEKSRATLGDSIFEKMSVGGSNADLIDRTLWRVTPSDHPASRPNSSAVKTSTFQAKRPCKLKRYLTQAYSLTCWNLGI